MKRKEEKREIEKQQQERESRMKSMAGFQDVLVAASLSNLLTSPCLPPTRCMMQRAGF